MVDNDGEIAANLERAETNLRAARDLLDGVSVHVASGEAFQAVQVAERFLASAKQILG